VLYARALTFNFRSPRRYEAGHSGSRDRLFLEATAKQSQAYVVLTKVMT
jgi:hypothetical protein